MKNIKYHPIYLFFLLFLAGCATIPKSTKQDSSLGETLEKKIVIGVLPFQNLSNDKNYDWLSLGIAESLTTALAGNKRLKIVERLQIDKVKEELAFGLDDLADLKAAQEMGKELGCNFTITGSFQILKGKIKVDARMIKSETGIIGGSEGVSVSVTGKVEDIFGLYEKLAKELLKTLNK